jgi:replicative superfamily II helicase
VELVLRTVYDLETAINWLKSTFYYVRLNKNPGLYGLKQLENKNFSAADFDDFLRELCSKNLNELMSVNLIESCKVNSRGTLFNSTFNGVLMARYCLAFETMKLMILNMRPLGAGYRPQTACEETPDLYLDNSLNYTVNKEQLDGRTCRQPNRNLANLVILY